MGTDTRMDNLVHLAADTFEKHAEAIDNLNFVLEALTQRLTVIEKKVYRLGRSDEFNRELDK